MTTTSADPYDALAPFYDLDLDALDALDDDLGLYRGFARRCEGPVLELGVGTGRVALALAASGHDVTGIDSSEAMLERGRQSEERLGVRVQFVLADMRDFDLDRQFDLVVCPLNGLRHLLTSDDQLAALGAVRRHITPDGLFVLDLPAWHTFDWDPGPAPLVLEWTRPNPENGNLVTRLSSARPDPAAQLQHLTIFYDEQDASGVVRRFRSTLELYTYTRNELNLLLQVAGLRPLNWYGSYDLSPYDSHSERLIAVARREDG